MSSSQIYINSDFRGVLKATKILDGSDQPFFRLPNNTTVSQIDIGIISLVRLGNIVYMNFPLFNFMSANIAANQETKLEILWQDVNYVNGSPVITYEPMSTFITDYIPKVASVASDNGNKGSVYRTFAGNDATTLAKIPDAAVKILELNANDYFKYCMQHVPSTGLISTANAAGALPTSCTNFSLPGGSVCPIQSYIPTTADGKGNSSYNKYICYDFNKITSGANPAYKLSLVITDDDAEYYFADNMSYPVTIYPFVYVYYV